MTKKTNIKLCIVITLGLIALALIVTKPARSQSKYQYELALLIARTCVAEIGFEKDSSVEECELMWAINHDNAMRKKRSLRRQTKLFNSYWKCNKGTRCYYQQRRRPWIKHLEGIQEPRHWPNTMKWSRYRDKWLLYRERALSFVLEPFGASVYCEGALDYGARGETPRLHTAKKIECLEGQTKQKYWTWK